MQKKYVIKAPGVGRLVLTAAGRARARAARTNKGESERASDLAKATSSTREMGEGNRGLGSFAGDEQCQVRKALLGPVMSLVWRKNGGAVDMYVSSRSVGPLCQRQPLVLVGAPPAMRRWPWSRRWALWGGGV